MKKFASLVFFAFLIVALPLTADTVILSSGGSYSGHFMGREMDGKIPFQDNQGVQYQFPIGDVQSITFNQTADTVTLRSGRSYVGRVSGPASTEISFIDNQGIRYRFPTNEVASVVFAPGWRGPYSSSGEGIVLGVGTEIAVWTDLAIDSRRARPGQTFPATIAQDVLDSEGHVVIRRNSPATLLLRNESEGGIHSADVVLDLDSVVVNGVRHHVVSSTVKETNGEGIGKNRRTAKFLGGMAALGALIGAAAGGGKGAAIGAGSGVGAGALAEVVTHGKRVYVPAETTLTFELDKPMVLRPGA